MHSWQCKGTITETCVGALSVPTVKEGHSRASWADLSRGRLQEFTPAPCQHGLLDVEGGRERDRSQVGEGGEEEVEAPARKSLLDGRLCVTLGDGKE